MQKSGHFVPAVTRSKKLFFALLIVFHILLYFGGLGRALRRDWPIWYVNHGASPCTKPRSPVVVATALTTHLSWDLRQVPPTLYASLATLPPLFLTELLQEPCYLVSQFPQLSVETWCYLLHTVVFTTLCCLIGELVHWCFYHGASTEALCKDL